MYLKFYSSIILVKKQVFMRRNKKAEKSLPPWWRSKWNWIGCNKKK